MSKEESQQNWSLECPIRHETCQPPAKSRDGCSGKGSSWFASVVAMRSGLDRTVVELRLHATAETSRAEPLVAFGDKYEMHLGVHSRSDVGRDNEAVL